MRIGGRGRQSTRKDTDQTKELAAKKEAADTKKGRSMRKEPGGILLRKRRKECRGMMIRIGMTNEPEGTLLKKRRSSRIGGRDLRSESNYSLTGGTRQDSSEKERTSERRMTTDKFRLTRTPSDAIRMISDAISVCGLQ